MSVCVCVCVSYVHMYMLCDVCMYYMCVCVCVYLRVFLNSCPLRRVAGNVSILHTESVKKDP